MINDNSCLMYQFCIFIFVIFFPRTMLAQSTLPDVVAAFGIIHDQPQAFHITSHHIKPPHGGHFQGIERLSDSLFIVTASSAGYSYYLTASSDFKTHGSVVSLHKITNAPFRHAGGCQVYGHTMIVGVEDNHAKDKSDIIMVSFNSAGYQTAQYTMAHRSGVVKRSTAGAVGFARLANGRYMVAVGDWDSRAIDLYLSHTGSDTMFDLLATFSVPDRDRWVSYQNLNLLTDSSGRLYLIAMGLDRLNDRADLYELNVSPHQADMRLLSSRNFKCRGGAGFRYASGIGINPDGKLIIYSWGMHLNSMVNIFQ
jgi:hypothetical protein